MILDKTKEHFISTKNIFKNNGWIIVVYGMVVSLIISIAAFIIGNIIENSLSNALKGFPSGAKCVLLGIPEVLLSSIVTGIVTVFIFGGLIYSIKNNIKINIPNFIKIGIKLNLKYFREIIILLIIPKIIIGMLGGSTLEMITDYIQFELITNFFSGIWLTTLLIAIVGSVYAGINIWVNMFFTAKFAINMDELNIDKNNNKFLFVIIMSLSVAYSIVSLIPVIGGFVSLFLSIILTLFFNIFVLTMDNNIKYLSNVGRSAMGDEYLNTNKVANPLAANGFDNVNNDKRLNVRENSFNNGFNNYNGGYNPQRYDKYNSYPNVNYSNRNINQQQRNGFNLEYECHYNKSHEFRNPSGRQNIATNQNYQNNVVNNANRSVPRNDINSKVCQRCGLQVHSQVMICPRCGTKI